MIKEKKRRKMWILSVSPSSRPLASALAMLSSTKIHDTKTKFIHFFILNSFPEFKLTNIQLKLFNFKSHHKPYKLQNQIKYQLSIVLRNQHGGFVLQTKGFPMV